MTTQDKILKKKPCLLELELAEFLKNVSEARRVNGYSKQYFYDVKRTNEEHGIQGLKEKSRRKPYMKNRAVREAEEAVFRMAIEYPYHRRHSALAGMTPYERFREKAYGVIDHEQIHKKRY